MWRKNNTNIHENKITSVHAKSSCYFSFILTFDHFDRLTTNYQSTPGTLVEGKSNCYNSTTNLSIRIQVLLGIGTCVQHKERLLFDSSTGTETEKKEKKCGKESAKETTQTAFPFTNVMKQVEKRESKRILCFDEST